MKSYLTVKKNGQVVRECPLGQSMKIGRHRNADLQLEDPKLSRVHAEIVREGTRFFLKDLGSLNGTLVGGVRLEKPVELQDGMSATFESYEVQFTIERGSPEEAPKDSRWSEKPPEASPLLSHLIDARGAIPLWEKGELTLQVADIIEETSDVKTFRLVGKTPILFSYKPGQFVTIVAEIRGEKVRRSYSMSSTPSRPHTIELTVKRVPGGLVSNWMCDELKLGDDLTVIGPAGKFSCFNYPSRKMLCIGAGSGITPLMSMSRWIVDTTADVDVIMLCSARTPNDIIFRKELELMSSRHSSFRLFFTVTRNWRGLDSWTGLNGHCTPAMLAMLVPDLQERHVFLCGPEEFMDCIVAALRGLDFPIPNLHMERFGKQKAPGAKAAAAAEAQPAGGVLIPHPAPAAPAAAAPAAEAPAKIAAPKIAPVEKPAAAKPVAPAPAAKSAIEIEFLGKGIKVPAEGDATLLEIAGECEVEIDYQCQNGTCGTCKVLCKSGTVRYNCDESDLALEADEIKQGYVLACVAVPRSSCAVEVPA